MLPPHRPFRDKPADALAAPVAARTTANTQSRLPREPDTRSATSARIALKAELKIAGRMADGRAAGKVA